MKVQRTRARPTCGKDLGHLILDRRAWDSSEEIPRAAPGRVRLTEDSDGPSTFPEPPVDPNTWLQRAVTQVGKILKFTPTLSPIPLLLLHPNPGGL